jgi:nucleotide-binding universal stress UspA family protein
MGQEEQGEVFENFAREFIRGHRTPRRQWRVDRILAPTDFSVRSLTALEHAEDLARAFGAELIVVHVEEVTPSELVELTNGVAEREVARVVKHLLADHMRACGLVRAGVPAAEILKVAEEEKVDLIVMGTHGRKGLQHLLLGSVAERIVRAARCPVLTVRPVDRK